MKQRRNPRSEPPAVYQDLGLHHEWPVGKAIVDLLTGLKGNSKSTTGNFFSPYEAQNKDLGAASQALPAGVWFSLKPGSAVGEKGKKRGQIGKSFRLASLDNFFFLQRRFFLLFPTMRSLVPG